MPRKEKYKKSIKRYTEVFNLYQPDVSFEALKKEAARMVGDLERWMDDQKKNGWEEEVEIYEETIFPQIKEAKKLRYRIYYQNPILNDEKVKLMVAQQSKDVRGFSEAQEKITEIECLIHGLVWRIYKIYSDLRLKIVLIPKLSKEEQENERREEMNDTGHYYDNDDLDKMGAI